MLILLTVLIVFKIIGYEHLPLECSCTKYPASWVLMHPLLLTPFSTAIV